MKRFILFLLTISTVVLSAQVTPTGAKLSTADQAGLLYASNFGQWQVPAGNLGQYSWDNGSYCMPTVGSVYPGITINAFTVGTPVEIVDTDTPTHNEIVTPNAVTISWVGSDPVSCSISITPVYGHNHFYFTSATGGLQEAINWAGTTPYQVIVTPDWSLLGGITSTITSATGNANVTILDDRTACSVAYLWSGRAYVAQGSSCTLGVVPPALGGTGVASPTGYAYGNGTSPFTFSTTIPYSALTGAPVVPTSFAFGAITSGMNINTLLVGSGGSLGPSGTGTIVATSAPYSGLTGTVPTWNQSTTGNAATATYATTAGSSTTATTSAQVANSLTLTNALATPTTTTYNGSSAQTVHVIDPTQTGGQTMAGPLNGIWPSSAFGVKADGVTDDTAAANSIGTFCAGLQPGYTAEINYPSNAVSINSGSITTWAQTNCHIYGHGTRLKHPATSTGPVLAVRITDGGAYSVCPTGATITGSGGSGATLILTCTGTSPAIKVSTVQMTAYGNAYPANSTIVSFTGGTGTSATAEAVVNPQIFLSPNGGTGSVNLAIEGFVLQGNANSSWGVYIDTSANGDVNHSSIDLINVQDQSVGCYYLSDYQLSITANFVCSAQVAKVMGVPQTTTPIIGAMLGDVNEPNGYFANNRVVKLTIEGVSGTGVICSRCGNENHFFGTSEENSIGWSDTSASGGNVISIDVEGNSVADVNESAADNTWIGTQSYGIFNVLGGATTGSIIGGTYQTINFSNNSVNWNLFNFLYNGQGGGTISGIGPNMIIENVLDQTTGKFVPNSIRIHSQYGSKFWDIFSEYRLSDSDLVFCANTPGNLASCNPMWTMDANGNLWHNVSGVDVKAISDTGAIVSPGITAPSGGSSSTCYNTAGGTTAISGGGGTRYSYALTSGTVMQGQCEIEITAVTGLSPTAVLSASLYDSAGSTTLEQLSAVAYNKNGVLGWNVCNVTLLTVTLETTTSINILVQ